MTLVDHKDTKSLAAAAGRGLVDDGLHLDSALDLGGPLQQGAIVTRPIPVEHEAGRAYVHDLVVELGHDAPDIGPDQEMVPRSAFDRMIREPWQGLLLLDGDDVAGITLAFPREEPGEANTAFTGVRRAWRGRGLSAPLKAAHARVLRDRGFRVLRTQTMEHNAAILRANARLGFRVTGGYRDLVHDF
jgi:GNAT superfamily N-acetyltransferase